MPFIVARKTPAVHLYQMRALLHQTNKLNVIPVKSPTSSRVQPSAHRLSSLNMPPTAAFVTAMTLSSPKTIYENTLRRTAKKN